MLIARQSTARTVTVGPVLDADGVAVTDCVVADFEGSTNGGDPAALNGSATLTHRGVGFYSLALTATDLGTVGSFEVLINDTVNACPQKEITVVEEAVYDALFAAAALGYVANAPVNVAQISGDSTAADNAEAFFDGTGYAGTNNVIPLVTTTTTATNVTTVNGLAADVITATAIQNDAITAAKIANGAIDAATFAADVDAEILSYLVDDATRIDASALNTAAGTTIPAILDDTDLIDDATSGLAKIATDVAAVLVDTAEIGAAGAGLTNINLPNQTMDIVGNITGNLSGSVGSVTGAVGSVTGNVGGNVTGSVGSVTAAVTVTGDAATAGTRLLTMIELDGAVYRLTTNALEQAPTGGGAADGSGFTAIPWNPAWDAEVQSECADALTAYGASTLTQTQITGGAYAMNNASFAFNAGLDFTTTQKAATLARVTLVDTTTTNTDMRGTNNAALAATALSTAVWTAPPTGFLAATFPSDPADQSLVVAATDALLAAVNTRQPTIWAAANSTVSLSGTTVAAVLQVADVVNPVTATGLSAVAADVTAILEDTGTTLPAQITALDVDAADVWDLDTTGHTTPGTFGAAMAAAGNAGDPWITDLPGAYPEGSAGHRIGNQVPQTGDSFARLGEPEGDSIAADIAAIETGGGSADFGTVLLTVEPQANLVDSNGNLVTAVTVAQALAALFVNLLGDRTGVDTRVITASVPGVDNCQVVAQRVSLSEIQMSITLPAAQ